MAPYLTPGHLGPRLVLISCLPELTQWRKGLPQTDPCRSTPSCPHGPTAYPPGCSILRGWLSLSGSPSTSPTEISLLVAGCPIFFCCHDLCGVSSPGSGGTYGEAAMCFRWPCLPQQQLCLHLHSRWLCLHLQPRHQQSAATRLGGRTIP